MEQKIKLVQKLFGLEQTGLQDNHTKSAIKNFNIRDGSGSDDTLTDDVFNRIFAKFGVNVDEYEEVDMSNDDITTDSEETTRIYMDYMLDSGEYVNSSKITNKEYIFIHHTAGWDDPYSTIDSWNSDNRGRIGTHYVIGGSNIYKRKTNSEFNGMVLKCIPDEYWAYHLGGTKKHKIDFHMHSHSIGIELCNFGYLIERGQAFYTYAGQRVDESEIFDLGYEFRGRRYWHSYSEEQINSLFFLLTQLSAKYNINKSNGLVDWLKNGDVVNAFDFKESARDGDVKGILSHTNVRNDKYDVYPHDGLVDMIKSL